MAIIDSNVNIDHIIIAEKRRKISSLFLNRCQSFVNPECDSDAESLYEEKCSFVGNPDGPFIDCFNKVPGEVSFNPRYNAFQN